MPNAAWGSVETRCWGDRTSHPVLGAVGDPDPGGLDAAWATVAAQRGAARRRGGTGSRVEFRGSDLEFEDFIILKTPKSTSTPSLGDLRTRTHRVAQGGICLFFLVFVFLCVSAETCEPFDQIRRRWQKPATPGRMAGGWELSELSPS